MDSKKLILLMAVLAAAGSFIISYRSSLLHGSETQLSEKTIHGITDEEDETAIQSEFEILVQDEAEKKKDSSSNEIIEHSQKTMEVQDAPQINQQRMRQEAIIVQKNSQKITVQDNRSETVPKETKTVRREQEPEGKNSFLIPKQIQSKAEALAGVKVDFKDMVKVADILAGKVSIGEIKFLYNTAKDNVFLNCSAEELRKVRDILFTNLSHDDLECLRQIGEKYGKDMRIINPDISVEEEKNKAESDIELDKIP